MMKVFCHFHCCKTQNIIKDIIYHLNTYFTLDFFFQNISGHLWCCLVNWLSRYPRSIGCGQLSEMEGGRVVGRAGRVGALQIVVLHLWFHIQSTDLSVCGQCGIQTTYNTASTSDGNHHFEILDMKMFNEIRNLYFHKKCQRYIYQWKKRKSY